MSKRVVSNNKKPATKKAAVKKITCADVQPECVFWVCDGRSLKNLTELAGALAEINDDIFKYHVNDTKNDFANWIRDVMKEEQLAQRLFKTIDKAKTRKIVLEFANKKK